MLFSEFPFLKEKVADLSSRVLFYPCSGGDLIQPIRLFAPRITTFWFVDIGYFQRTPPEMTPNVFQKNRDFIFIEREIKTANLPTEEWIDDPKYRGTPPYILTEKYIHHPSETLITIHRHMRRGPSALRKEIDRLGVFFYRGDSSEGGSGTLWLAGRRTSMLEKKGLPSLIIDKLVDGGLIATDGSLCNVHGNLYGFFRTAVDEVARTSDLQIRYHIDPFGNRFDFLANLGTFRGNPTLLWRLTKANSD
jgi:hypothetical protein